ncbi:hypothetical protein CP061683_0092B, partial [Chlamydia psittaci 06-1683]
LQELLDR